MRAVPPAPPPLLDVAGTPLPPVDWTHSFDFDNGPQGWVITSCGPPCPPGAAHWVDPAVEPNGPELPDDHDGDPGNGICLQCESGTSGWLGETQSTGGGSLYLPGANFDGDESVAERTIQSITGLPVSASMVMQVDIYVPNLLPLTGFRHDGAFPGNHVESAGFCLLREDFAAMCFEGCSATGGPSPHTSYNGFLRFRDFTGSAGNSWQFPTCCAGKRIMNLEGAWPVCHNTINTDKDFWWDKWITLYVNYNYSKSNEVYVWAYIPWTHPEPDCTIAATASGWIEIVRRTLDSGGFGPQNWSMISLGGRFSWTQSQWDNVKLAIQPTCHAPPVDGDGDGDVDMDDFGEFQRCYTGSDPPGGVFDSATCRCFDRYPRSAPDNAIDAGDLQIFLACAGRANVPPPTGCEE